MPGSDPWRRPFRFMVDGDRCRVRSAGLDGIWDSSDDVGAECRPDWRP